MARWKEVAGYEGLYLVSDEGEVVSLPRVVDNGRGVYVRQATVLKPGKRAGNYCFVCLRKDGQDRHFSVHRLVAEAFIENPLGLPQVNHKDENPENNRADNLEWCTQQYNIEYSKAKRVCQYAKSGEKIAEYKSISVAAQMTGIGRTAINNALCGWSRFAGGYIWKYEEEE